MTHIWHQNYVGICHHIAWASLDSMVNLIEHALQKFSHNLALHCLGTTCTYREIKQYSREAVTLFVVTNDEALGSDVSLDHCKNNLAANQVPRRIEFINQLLKSTVGKVLWRELRQVGC